MDTDVVELILADHVEFERLLRALRLRGGDRSAARDRLSALLVAHAEAEEAEVYPRLRDLADEHEVEHGEKEHADGHVALLALLKADDVDSDAFDRCLARLSATVSHHLDEEERTLLNDARERLSAAERTAIGQRWQATKTERIAAGCGTTEYVKELVARCATTSRSST